NGAKVLRVPGEDAAASIGESKIAAKSSESRATQDAPSTTETKANTLGTERASLVETPWRQGDPVPKSSKAVIDRAKFERYSMDPNNKANGGKAIAFKKIGYDVDTASGRQIGA